MLCDLKVFFDVDDAEEELSSVEFFRMITRLSSYKGALRHQLEVYAREHEDELKPEAKLNQQPLTMTPDQLRSSPVLGAAPAAGQAAPIFDVKTV